MAIYQYIKKETEQKPDRYKSDNQKETFSIQAVQTHIPMNEAQQNKWTKKWKPKYYNKFLPTRTIRHDEFNNEKNVKATLVREYGIGITQDKAHYTITIFDYHHQNKQYNPNYKCKKPYCKCYTQHKTKPKKNQCRQNMKYRPSRKTICKIIITQTPTQQIEYAENWTNKPYTQYNCKILKEDNKLKSLWWYEKRK